VRSHGLRDLSKSDLIRVAEVATKKQWEAEKQALRVAFALARAKRWSFVAGIVVADVVWFLAWWLL